MHRRRLTRASLAVVGCAALTAGVSACSDDGNGGENAPTTARVVMAFPEAQPGDLIALRASDTDPSVVEWIDRRAGTVGSIDTAERGSVITVLAAVDVGAVDDQRGLLGHTVIDGVRYAAWTDPVSDHLLVGTLGSSGENAAPDGPATVERIVWDGGGTAGGAVGGHLDRSADGQLVLGIGQRTDWARANGSGAMLQLDPLGPPDQTPIVLSDGYTNPFAFTVTDGLDEPLLDGQLWVADNAVGDDVERIGRGDPGTPLADRSNHPVTGADPRAPSAMEALPDGRLAICGFLDGRLQAWQPSELLPPAAGADPPAADSVGTLAAGADLGECLTGVTRLGNGALVTATADSLVVLAP